LGFRVVGRRVETLGLEFESLGFRVWGFNLKVLGLGFRVQGAVYGSGCNVGSRLGFRMQCGVQGSGCSVSGCSDLQCLGSVCSLRFTVQCLVLVVLSLGRCRANSARIRQSRPDSCLGLSSFAGSLKKDGFSSFS